MATPKTAQRNRARQNAAQRGYEFERRLAGNLEHGLVWPGKDGDVEAYDRTFECKFRTELKSLGEIPDFIEQAKRNGVARGLPWALALTGGRGFYNAETYVLAPLTDWDRLFRLEGDRIALTHFMDKYPDTRSALLAVFDQMVFDFAVLTKEGFNEEDPDDPGLGDL